MTQYDPRMQPALRMRPTTKERDQYLDALTESYVDGRLDQFEYGTRRDAVLEAVTHADILAQFDGLPAPGVLVPVVPQRPAAPKPAPVPVKHAPVKKNWAAIVAGGIVAAMMAGIGVAWIGYTMDTSMNTFPEEIVVANEQVVSPLTVEQMQAGLEKLKALGYNEVGEVALFDNQLTGEARTVGEKHSSFTFNDKGLTSISDSGMVPESIEWVSIEQMSKAISAASPAAKEAGITGAVDGMNLTAQNGKTVVIFDFWQEEGISQIAVDMDGTIVSVSHG